MTLQINGAHSPSGLIANAKTYSVILADGGVYLIHVGPAGNQVRTHNGLELAVVANVHGRIAKKVAEGEVRLKSMGAAALAQEKHSAFLTSADIRNIALNERVAGQLRLKIKSSKGSYHLWFNDNVKPQIEQIVAQLSG